MPRFVPRQRKHKVLARQTQSPTSAASAAPNADTNQDILIPESQSQKELRRQQLKAELRAQQSKISSKKQKRLDKYIETKLRKDETLDYLRRLEKEKAKFDVKESEGFVSSKSLNKNVNGRKRGWTEYVQGQVDTEDQISSVANAKTAIGLPEILPANHDDEDSASVDSFEAEHQSSFGDTDQLGQVNDAQWLAKKAPSVQGNGLARPLEIGADGLPVIPVTKKRVRPLVAHNQDDDILDENMAEMPLSEEHDLPWEGFSSASERSSDEEHEEEAADNEDASTQSDSSQEEADDYADDSDEHESESESSNSDISEQQKPHIRSSAFKTWAVQQLNEAIGHTPLYSANPEGVLPAAALSSSGVDSAAKDHVQKKSIEELINGLPAFRGEVARLSVHSVEVHRESSIQESRSQLPILKREQEIMEAIHNNPVVVVKGDTGSGKTTQVPQFLYEAGYGDPNGPNPGMIGITQPRRVAAVSMAKRVGQELGTHGHKVSHQIRFDSTTSSETAVKFMTDGILLRELSQDLLLKKYSAIIVDEAHERSVNTDILIGMLSKIVPARMRKDKFNPEPRPLKLIIMSATLNIGDFLNDKLFPVNLRPPVVEAEGRQHRVTMHFARTSRADYVEEVIEKIKRAHHKLPRGGILVFLTGQNEIREVQARLRQDLVRSGAHAKVSERHTRMHLAATEVPLEVDDLDFGIDMRKQADTEEEVEEVNIMTQCDEEEDAREFEVSDDDDDDDDDNDNNAYGQATTLSARQSNPKQYHGKDPYDGVHILPLYSQLPTKEQLRVFEPPPERSRMIVLATNVAETSLTIPGIKYVFDCGRSKERKYNLDTGVQSFEIDYISKASAQQRAGRAGRTGPGHCWRLYSSAVYERFFPDHSEPEILRAPAENVVLQIKGFAYPRPVIEFPFPTAPSLQMLDKAERLLRNLGGLDTRGMVTDTGKQLSVFPLSPRLGKMLAVAVRDSAMISPIIALVAGLAVSEIFVNDVSALAPDMEDDDTQEQDQKKQAYGRARATLSRHDKMSDAMRLLTTVLSYVEAPSKETFCKDYFVRVKAMAEVLLLLQQLKSIVQANHASLQIPAMKDPKKWSSAQTRQINMTTAAGFIDQVAVRWDCAPNPPSLLHKPRRAIDVPYLPLIPLGTKSSSELFEKAIFIHPSSVLSRISIKDLPRYIVYTHLQQSQLRTIGSEQIPKTRMFPLTHVDAASLGQLARDTALLEYGKPIPKTKIEELPGVPKRRICWLHTELRSGIAGSYGWSLPPTKVRQVLDIKSASGWRVEEVLI